MESRNEAYQKPAIDIWEFKKRNDATAVQLRKNQRFDKFQEKRQLLHVEDIDEWSVEQILDIYPQLMGKGDAEQIAILGEEILNPAIGDPQRFQILRFWRDFLCHSLENVSEFFNSGLVPSFITMMGASHPNNIVFEASWCLCNMASSNYTQQVSEAGALQAFLEAARRGDQKIIEACLHGIACLIHDSRNERKRACADGTIDVVMGFLRTPGISENYVETAMYCLAALVRGAKHKEQEALAKSRECCQIVLASNPTRIDIIYFVLNTLYSNARADPSSFADSPFLPIILFYLREHGGSIADAAIEILAQLSQSSDDEICSEMLREKILDTLTDKFVVADEFVRKKSWFILSNLIAEQIFLVEEVLSHRVITLIPKALIDVYSVALETSWFLYNISKIGLSHHILCLLDMNVFEAIARALTTADKIIAKNLVNFCSRAIKEDNICIAQGKQTEHKVINLIAQMEIDAQFEKIWNKAKGKDLADFELFFEEMQGDDVDLELPDQEV